MAAAVTITSEQKIKITVAPQTEGGNPAEVDGDVLYEVVSGDATVEPVDGTGGKEAYLVSGESGVLSVVRVYADGDTSEAEAMIEDEISLTVIAPGAASLGVAFGEPEAK